MADNPARQRLHLPPPEQGGEAALGPVIRARRSVRHFDGRPLSLAAAGQLLWAAQGFTDPRGLRAAPSAGALYPLELYLVTGPLVDGPSGVYRYLPSGHRLQMVGQDDVRRPLARAALGQNAVGQAPATVAICAVYGRVTGKYGDRGRRYVHLEAGHAAQNIHLQAVALGLGSVPIGAFHDRAVQDVLGVAPDEIPLYLLPTGYPR